MRYVLFLSLFALAACSSSTPERAENASDTEQVAAENTNNCLDNPELARTWGDCNVKHTLFDAAAPLAACRKLAPKAKAGNLNFELQVIKGGKVKYAKAKSKSNYPKLEACISKVLKGLKFAEPPTGKEPVITVPYQLEP